MNNYICINGKKAELTEEQMKALGIELPKESPFTFCRNRDEPYYFITSMGSVVEATGHASRLERYAAANYCTDKAILEQRALHEWLNRLLWRYSMEHGGDKINLNNSVVFKYGIKHTAYRNWTTFSTNAKLFGVPLFVTEKTAEAAIKEIIEPFMKAHPEFKW